MQDAERGAYLSALLQQWQSGERQCVPDELERLRVICGGDGFTLAVREKFIEVEIDGRKYLRNERLANEWSRAFAEHQAKSYGGKQRAKLPTKTPAKRAAKQEGELPRELVQIPEPRTQIPDPRIQETPEPINGEPPSGGNGVARKSRERDLVFEAVCRACALNWNDITEKKRGAVNQI